MTHHVQLLDEKLICSCYQFTFAGLPCSHILCVAHKKDLKHMNLRIKDRWKLSFEGKNQIQNQAINEKQESREEQKTEELIQNDKDNDEINNYLSIY
jgi:hypothetical protein